MPGTGANISGRRRVLVTGAATGIGAAIVDVFVNSGADVVATFHEAPAPERSPASWLRCDVTSVNSVDETVDAAAAAMGAWTPSFMPPACGYRASRERLPTRTSIGSCRSMCAGPFTSIAAHRIMQGSGGRIINFGSAEAVMGSPISAVYAATKERYTRGRAPPPRPGAVKASP